MNALASKGLAPQRPGRISLDMVAPKVRKWLYSNDRSTDPKLTQYAPERTED